MGMGCSYSYIPVLAIGTAILVDANLAEGILSGHV